MNNKKGWFCLNEVLIGRRFPKFMIQLIRSKISSDYVIQELVLRSRRLTSKDCLKYQLINSEVDQDNLRKYAINWMKSKVVQLNSNQRQTVHRMKLDLYNDVLKKVEEIGYVKKQIVNFFFCLFLIILLIKCTLSRKNIFKKVYSRQQ